MSHNRLLAASGHHGIHVERRPLTLADLDASDLINGLAAACELGARPESAKAARDFTRVTLQQWGLGRHSDMAELVVSELVTNALRHGLLSASRMLGEHPVGLRLLRNDPYLICVVTDPGSAGPLRIETCAGAESGRGLQVVQACSGRAGRGEQRRQAGLGLAALTGVTGGRWPARADQPPAGTRIRRPGQAGQESRSSNSPSLAPRRNASISVGV